MKYWVTTVFYIFIVLITYLDFSFWWLLAALAVDYLVSRQISTYEAAQKELVRTLTLVNNNEWRQGVCKTEYYLDYLDEADLALSMDDKKEFETLKKRYNLFSKLLGSNARFPDVEDMPNDLALRFSERHKDY